MNTNTLLVVVALFVGVLIGYITFSNGAPRFGGDGGMRANIDRHFIEQMIPHHEGAIQMAELALERSTSEEVLSLARGIKEAQTKEISDMRAWYAEWFGGEVSGGINGSMGHGGGHMQGMEGDLDELMSSDDFDKEFLKQMIVHHEMAVMMATMLDAGTERGEMKILADQIITSQSKEIAMMKSWLTK